MIPQIKKILFATDSAKTPAYAFFLRGSIWAKRDEAKIVIMHAVEPIAPMLVSFEDFKHQVAKDRWEETVKKFKERITGYFRKGGHSMGVSSVDLVSNILIRLG